jgi:hypothetical protein
MAAKPGALVQQGGEDRRGDVVREVRAARPALAGADLGPIEGGGVGDQQRQLRQALLKPAASSRSISTTWSAAPRRKSASVSTPRPGPISKVGAPGLISARSAMRSMKAGWVKKFWPKRRFAPRPSSRSALAALWL